MSATLSPTGIVYGSRDFTQRGAFDTIVSEQEMVDLVSDLGVKRARGLLTRNEWREEILDVLDRTVPGETWSKIVRSLPDWKDPWNRESSSADPLIDALVGV